MPRKPSSAGSYAKFKCPLCSKVVKRHVPKTCQSVVSWCSAANKTVLLGRVPDARKTQ